MKTPLDTKKGKRIETGHEIECSVINSLETTIIKLLYISFILSLNTTEYFDC